MTTNFRLGYIGVSGDVGDWKRFAEDIYGLQGVESDQGLRLRVDERLWRISVESGEDGLQFIGFELDSIADLNAAQKRLQKAGFEAVNDQTLAQRRDVSQLVRAIAPDGTPIELFVGALTTIVPFSSPTGARFVTGKSGLGHVLMLVPDIEESLSFYEKVLGFRRSDTVVMGPGIDAHFLNGGYRHHVVALASLPDVTGFDHLYLEVDSIESVGQAWDKVQAGAAPIARSIGQHANDPAISFYAQSPSGFLLEYGVGSTVIDDYDSWTQTRWESAYLWGGTSGSHSVR